MNSGHNTAWAECHVTRLQSGQNPSRQTPSWTESQVDRSKLEQNPELTKPLVDTILRGQHVMWPDFLVERIQVDKYPGGQTPKWREPYVKRIQS